MKSYFRTMMAAGAMAAILGTAAVSNAQSTESTTRVPFAFTAGSSSLPAGAYRVSVLAGRNAVLIRGLDRGAIILSEPEGPSRGDDTPRMVFERYGTHYILREIRLPGNVGFTIPSAGAEIEASDRAANTVKPEIVVVRMGH